MAPSILIQNEDNINDVILPVPPPLPSQFPIVYTDATPTSSPIIQDQLHLIIDNILLQDSTASQTPLQPLLLTYAMAVEAKVHIPPPNLAPKGRVIYMYESCETIKDKCTAIRQAPYKFLQSAATSTYVASMTTIQTTLTPFPSRLEQNIKS